MIELFRKKTEQFYRSSLFTPQRAVITKISRLVVNGNEQHKQFCPGCVSPVKWCENLWIASRGAWYTVTASKTWGCERVKDGVGSIDTYLHSKLKPLLISLKVSIPFVEEALESVGSQISSFVSHWDDLAFRNGLMVVGLEEGSFYKPYSEISPFVVVAIRNSLLESLNSCEHGRTGLEKPLSDDSVREITKQAILHFKDIDLNSLHGEVEQTDKDYYASVVAKYPVSWAALKELGSSDEICISYEKVPGDRMKPRFLSTATGTPNEKNAVRSKVVLDGFSPLFDDNLLNYLRSIYLDRMDYVYFDCFKMLTRNFEKLLKVMEFVLSNEKPFVTCNYYISNGFIQKRKTLLRPARNDSDWTMKLVKHNGTTGKHREALVNVARVIKEQNP